MAAVQAYVYFRRFGLLPRAGGTFDQPADLMDELDHVANEVTRHERRQQDAEKRRADRKRRTSSRGRR